MKGLLCHKKSIIFHKKTLLLCLFALPLLAFLVLLCGFSRNVSAVSPTSSHTLPLSAPTSYLYFNFSSSSPLYGQMNNNDLLFLVGSHPSALNNPDITEIGWNWSKTVPANSIVSFSITWQLVASQVDYYGLNSLEGTVLSDSCYDPNANTSVTGMGYVNTFTCHYLVYYGSASGSFHTSVNSRVWKLYYMTTGQGSISNIFISQGNYITLSNDGLSESDRAWLEAHMPAGQSQASIEQAVENANNSSFESQREELDSEASDYQTGLEDNADQESINTKMTSILSVISDFVSAVATPVISTCILPIHLENFHGFGFYEVDLCYLSPPSGVTTVLNVIFIFFVLGLAYSAVRSTVNMYKEVIDG